MRKITSYEIALSAFACTLATIALIVTLSVDFLVGTGYLLAGIALMLPLAKRCYAGYALAYVATSVLTLLFCSWRFWDVFPFLIFFGLHPLVNELQLKIKINRWVACAIKALWFDVMLYLSYLFTFAITTDITATIPNLNAYMVPIILIFGTLFFVFYDMLAYRCRAFVNRTVARFDRKK